MQQTSAINGKLWHFADGPEQEARDLSMQDEVTGRPLRGSANQWSDQQHKQGHMDMML
jgi:salicylate hydroxylase